MVEVTDSFEDDVLLQLFLVIMLLWVYSNLSVYRSELSIWELDSTPETIVQFTTSPSLGFSLSGFWERLHAVSESSASSLSTLNEVLDVAKTVTFVDIVAGSTAERSAFLCWRLRALQVSLCSLIDLDQFLPAGCKSSASFGFALA
jgi:hypothetical protein